MLKKKRIIPPKKKISTEIIPENTPNQPENQEIKANSVVQTIETEPQPMPEILTATIYDRMLRYSKPIINCCPVCHYMPVITKLRRRDSQGKLIYALYRCRNCDHRWEEDNT